ncbi:N-acetyl-anhydromuranmyl-L-alanine amidase [Acidocella aquatica]|uniref:N-acetylmuramoyl-L-alanine amidase n=1 Tax=Acidocella aquatica TaxID=1922313 RepID=A0ABQ6A8A0_9PROT|nr:N-acetyl-anhydromuranmyl-L-alanine amidase [Acidocella aquatica]
MIPAPSPNFDERPGGVAFLVLHYTGMQTAEAAIARLRDPVAKVSAHYVVDEDGAVYALVAEEKRAWHAGVSFWRGVSMLNDASIGIEIVNPGHAFGYVAFPARQMAAVTALCLEVLGRWPAIVARNVVGHSDIAPDRKWDPGELFDWRGLAAAGVGLWSDGFAPPGDLLDDLAAIGYDTRFAARDVIIAFQRHFLPEHLSGEADMMTAARAAAVRALIDAPA